MLQLNLGCGHDIKPASEGWRNVDLVSYAGVDTRASLDDLRMFRDGVVDHCYAKSVLEHFSYRQLPTFLEEWNRVLKVGGTLHIITAYLEGLGKAITSGNYPWMEINDWMYARDIALERHKCFFSPPGLQQLLEEAGFEVIEIKESATCIWALECLAKKI